MEHRSSRAALNCDDFPPARICIGRDGGLWYRAELQSRSVVRAEPGETTLSLSLSLFLSRSLYLSWVRCARGTAYGYGRRMRTRTRTRRRFAEYMLRSWMLVCSIRRGSRQRETGKSHGGKRKPRRNEMRLGGKERRGKRDREIELEKGTRKRTQNGRAARWGWSMQDRERVAITRANPFRKQSRILTLIYRANSPLCSAPLSACGESSSRSRRAG